MRGYGHEANISTEQAQTRPQPRVPQTYVHQGRPGGDQPAPRQGPQAAGRLNFPAPARAVRFFLRKEDRLLKRADFLALSQAGRRVYSGFFLALVAPNRAGRARLGITVSRKVGGAVQRNRIKRLAREGFRLNRHRLKLSGDINLIARSGAAVLSNPELRQAIEELFEKVTRHIGA